MELLHPSGGFLQEDQTSQAMLHEDKYLTKTNQNTPLAMPLFSHCSQVCLGMVVSLGASGHSLRGKHMVYLTLLKDGVKN